MIRTEKHDDVLLLTIDRPAAYNAPRPGLDDLARGNG